MLTSPPDERTCDDKRVAPRCVLVQSDRVNRAQLFSRLQVSSKSSENCFCQYLKFPLFGFLNQMKMGLCPRDHEAAAIIELILFEGKLERARNRQPANRSPMINSSKNKHMALRVLFIAKTRVYLQQASASVLAERRRPNFSRR